MQPLKPYKFLQEQVFEGVWPFNRFQSPINVGLLTLLYSFWGVIIFLFFKIPFYFFVAGISGVIGITVWTLGIFRYANILRNTQVEKLNIVSRKFLIQYLDTLFHPSSIFIGILIYTVTLAYLFTPYSPIITIQEELEVSNLSPFILLFIFLISFDLSYRLGLSTYVMFVQIRRNLLLGQMLSNPRLKKYFVPRNIRALEKADYYHYLALGGGIFLFPLFALDPILVLALCFYLFIAFFTATINILHLRILITKAIPLKIIKLLRSSRFAYIGTTSMRYIPHVTPVLFIFDGRRIFLSTSVKSKKVQHLRKQKAIAVCIEKRQKEDLTKSQGVLIQGRARLYGHNLLTGVIFIFIYSLRMLIVRRLFSQKYPHYLIEYQKQDRFLPSAWKIKLNPQYFISRTLIEVIPEKFIYWKGTKFSRISF